MNALQLINLTGMNFFKTLLYRRGQRYPSSCAFVLALMLLCCSQAVSADKLTASVDRTEIGLEETLTLSVRYDEQIMFGEPDFDDLKQDFDILGNRRANQYRSINGVAESSTQWTITLAPKRKGNLKIPAFSYKNSSSKPITINVKETAPPTLATPDQPVFIETEIEKSSGYVQEQILYKVRLFTSVDLSGLNSEELRVNNALVKQISENQFQKTVKGRRYGVVEVTYAIFAQQSGTLTLPSTLWNITVQSNQSLAYDPFMSRSGKLLRLRTPEKTIEILPRPDDYNGDNWLPANNITLSQKWSSNPKKFKVGEPITRQISIIAEGLMAAQLPPLQLEAVDGIKYYPDQPQSEEKLSSDGITTIKTESYAVVPNQSGELTLPAITLTWWDVKQQQTRIARLAAQTIKVSGSTLSNAPTVEAGTTESTPFEFPGQEEPAREEKSRTATNLWFYLTLLFSFTTLLFALLWLSARQHKANAGRENTDNLAAASERKAYRQLLKTLKTDNLKEMRQALLTWGQSRYSNDQITSLSALGKRVPELKSEIDHLERQLYAKDALGFDGSKLIRQLQQINRGKAARNPNGHDTDIPPLYR